MTANRSDNREVASRLKEVALLLELKGENPFKVRAYSNAARSIETLEEDLRILLREGRLREIEGVGHTLASQIADFLNTGRLPLLEELRSAVPPGHLELLKIPGLGPKKIKFLHDLLQIKTLGELEYACLENRLVELQGFGKRTQEKILQGIQQVKKYQGRFLYGEVFPTAQELSKRFLAHPKVIRASLAGSVRRKMEVVRNINLVLATHEGQEVLRTFSRASDVQVVRFEGKEHGVYSLSSGIEVDVQTAPDRFFPFRLYQLTGNHGHWEAIRERAKAFGLELGEQGLRRGNRSISCKEEEGIFAALGLDPIPPELRENQGEIEAAESHHLPGLVEDRDLKGVFHVHSSYSDGTSSIRALVDAAREIGFSYLGLSDHSQSARYARGLPRDRLEKQWAEVDLLNQSLQGFKIFKGIETDIRPDGSLDYEDDLLEQFDFVIASVHSHFDMPLEEMTYRVLRALRNPYTTILGHPTGRLLLSREPYAIDMTRVITTAAERGVAIELNAHPYRLDLDWRLCKYAKEQGVKVSINPDAHHEEGLRDTFFGVGIARKGWLEPGDILNALDLAEMERFLKERKTWKKKRIASA